MRASLCALFLLWVGTFAQAQTLEPLSAIDWLSEVFEAPETGPAVPLGFDDVPSLGVEELSIEVTPLGRASPDTVGVLPQSMTGLPLSLWRNSREEVLVTLIRAETLDTLPAMRELLTMLLLAEADAPFDAHPKGPLFQARVDKLLDLGAISQAQSLIEAANPDTAELFSRWFDISLLTGTEARACATLRAAPDIEPTYAARVFCTARGQDWDAAALILNTGMALGDISGEEQELLLRFLDDSYAEIAEPLAPPTRISPLIFRIREAIGERIPTSGLPVAFAHADLVEYVSWRSRLEAAERLSRLGVVDDNVLQALYTFQTPAASGGIWDRAEAFQRFDTAITARDPSAIAATLPDAWSAMEAAGTQVAFARLYAPELARLPLSSSAASLNFRIQLLSRNYEGSAMDYTPQTSEESFLVAVARGQLIGVEATTLKQEAVKAGFTTTVAPQAIQALLAEDKLGEALLRSIATFNEGLVGDPAAVAEALAVLRAVGLQDFARRASLQYLLLDQQA